MTQVLLISLGGLAIFFMLTFLRALIKDARARQPRRKQTSLTEVILERYPNYKRAA